MAKRKPNSNKKKTLVIIISAIALLLTFAMLPLNAFAAVDFDINGSDKNDGYYNVISKQDWDIAPGIKESEIVLNNDAGTYRQSAAASRNSPSHAMRR